MTPNKNLYTIRLLIILALFLLLVSEGYGQGPKNSSWVTVQSDTKDFSIAFPADYQVFSDKKGFKLGTFTKKGSISSSYKEFEYKDIKYLTAFHGGASFFVISYQSDDDQNARALLTNGYATQGEYSELVLGGFRGVTFFRSSNEAYWLQMMIGYKDRVYHIFGGAASRDNESLKRFFSSIRLNGERPFSLNSDMKESTVENEVLIKTLPDTPFTVENEDREIEKTKSELPSNLLGKQPSDFTKPMLIMSKLKASYTDKARKAQTRGTVRLKVTFAADGSISKIVILNKGLPNGLNEQAIQSARLIRFLPQEKENTPVTVQKIVEYGFSIY